MMTMEITKSPRRKPFFRRSAQSRGLWVALAVLIAVCLVWVLSASRAFGYSDFSSTAASTASLALAAMGETIVIIAGGIDLSAGAVLSLSNCLFVSQAGTSTASLVLWAVFAIAAGGVVGAFNGFFVAYMRLQPIVVTLATMFITQGVTLLIMRQPGGSVPEAFSTAIAGDLMDGRLSMPFIVIVIAWIVWWAMRRSRFGTGMYAIGSDESSAHLKSLSTRKIKFLTYVIAGCFYGAAGVYFSAQTGGADPLVGAGMVLPVFVAVVLGGTPLGGGRGSCLGSIIGTFSVTLIANVLLVLNISTYYSTIVEGAILILAVLGSSSALTHLRELRLPRRKQAVAQRASPTHALLAAQNSGSRDAHAGGRDARPFVARHRDFIRVAALPYAGAIVLMVATLLLNSGVAVGGYLHSLLVLVSFSAVLALGQGVVVLSGGLDLSVPYSISLAGVLLTGLTNGSEAATVWALPTVLVLGIVVGVINGIGVAWFRMTPLIMTLAMNGILQGVVLVYSNGASLGASPESVHWFMTSRLWGITPVVYALVMFAAVSIYLVHFTVYGRRLFAVGSNPLASEYAGVPVKRILISTYALSGLCSALVGVMMTGFSGQAFNDMGDPYLLTSIAVVVVGGTMMTGGRGQYVGMLGGALLLTALATLLSGSTLPPAAKSIVYGVVVLMAVFSMREKRTA